MLGTHAQPGLMISTLSDLFNMIRPRDSVVYKATLSYIEIYNEAIRDLLIEGSPDLELREDGNGASVVCGVTSIRIESPEEVLHTCSATCHSFI